MHLLCFIKIHISLHLLLFRVLPLLRLQLLLLSFYLSGLMLPYSFSWSSLLRSSRCCFASRFDAFSQSILPLLSLDGLLRDCCGCGGRDVGTSSSGASPIIACTIDRCAFARCCCSSFARCSARSSGCFGGLYGESSCSPSFGLRFDGEKLRSSLSDRWRLRCLRRGLPDV
jgi:hypothetical protein